MKVLKVAVLVFVPALAQAKTVVVEMKSISFDPKVAIVHVGDKVEWKNVSYTDHSATQDAGAPNDVFDTKLIEPKKTSKPVEFKAAGSYKYHCSVHGRTMSGTIEVQP